MVISRMKTEDVTDAARIEEKIFSTPWSEQSFLEALEQEYTQKHWWQKCKKKPQGVEPTVSF